MESTILATDMFLELQLSPMKQKLHLLSICGTLPMKYLLLLIPCILCLWVPLYNSVEPRLAGLPLLYWFLILMVPISSLFIWFASKIEGSDS